MSGVDELQRSNESIMRERETRADMWAALADLFKAAAELLRESIKHPR